MSAPVTGVEASAAPAVDSTLRDAASACAQRAFAELEKRSPTFAAELHGLRRELVQIMLEMSFIDGSIHALRGITQRPGSASS